MDNFKVIYKILRQLEKNMGNEDFSVNLISAKAMNISYERWEQLMIIMQDEGYINGIITAKSIENMYRHITEPIHPQITLKGLEYLSENTLMAKAKETLKLIGEII